MLATREEHTNLSPAVAAAIDDARTACDALATGDALRLPMTTFIDAVVERLQSNGKSTPPKLPNRYDNLNKLAANSPIRPARAAAFAAMDALLEVGWPPVPVLSNAARQVRKRQKQHQTVSTILLPDYAQTVLAPGTPLDASRAVHVARLRRCVEAVTAWVSRFARMRRFRRVARAVCVASQPGTGYVHVLLANLLQRTRGRRGGAHACDKRVCWIVATAASIANAAGCHRVRAGAAANVASRARIRQRARAAAQQQCAGSLPRHATLCSWRLSCRRLLSL